MCLLSVSNRHWKIIYPNPNPNPNMCLGLGLGLGLASWSLLSELLISKWLSMEKVIWLEASDTFPRLRSKWTDGLSCALVWNATSDQNGRGTVVTGRGGQCSKVEKDICSGDRNPWLEAQKCVFVCLGWAVEGALHLAQFWSKWCLSNLLFWPHCATVGLIAVSFLPVC